MHDPSLILASTSPYRAALLQRLQVPFTIEPSAVDEEAMRELPPEEMAVALAIAKARAVASRFPEAVVIGSDQVAEAGGRVFGKAGDAGRAVEQLLALSGGSHRLITAVAVAQGQRVETCVDVHTLWMRPLTRPMAEGYVARDNPIDCAGSYRLESLGIALFERIEADPETADDTAIIGLPLTKTLAVLRRFGVDPLAR